MQRQESPKHAATTTRIQDNFNAPDQRSLKTGHTRLLEIRPPHGFPFKREALRWPDRK
jgi:hypothetical protein